jgi:hypothetical protein
MADDPPASSDCQQGPWILGRRHNEPSIADLHHLCGVVELVSRPVPNHRAGWAQIGGQSRTDRYDETVPLRAPERGSGRPVPNRRVACRVGTCDANQDVSR